jgi:redox-sensitive bicupin YhaK (pirin superfamily)
MVVVGEVNKMKGPIVAKSPLIVLRLDILKGGELKIPIPKEYNAIIYQLDGALKSSEDHINTGAKKLIWFHNDADHIFVIAKEDTRAILLAGIPIHEKITTHGPFVMNTQTEIMEAFRDYQMGKMGVLIEEFE